LNIRNTSGTALNTCSIELRQKIQAWSQQLDTILDEAMDEGIR
jgi:hypothetical protein